MATGRGNLGPRVIANGSEVGALVQLSLSLGSRNSGMRDPPAPGHWLLPLPDSFTLTPYIAVVLMQLDDSAATGYTFGMKTAISLPDDVFKDAERFARRSKKSRSQLYSEAITEYLARHAVDDVTERMNHVCDRIGTTQDSFVTEAARKLLSKETW